MQTSTTLQKAQKKRIPKHVLSAAGSDPHSIAPVSATRWQVRQGRSEPTQLWSTLADQWLLSVCSTLADKQCHHTGWHCRGAIICPTLDGCHQLTGWLQRRRRRMCVRTSAHLPNGEILTYICIRGGIGATQANRRGNMHYWSCMEHGMQWKIHLQSVSQITPGKTISLFSLAGWLDQHVFTFTACAWIGSGSCVGK